MKKRTRAKTTLPIVIAGIIAAPALDAATTFDDFSSDPNIAGDWTQYSYFGSENTTPVWNSTDEDLDLDGGGGGGAVLGLYRTGDTRSASDLVTMTVVDFNVAGGSWYQVGLMIGDTAAPDLLDSNERYEWTIRWESGTYKLRVRKDVGTGGFDLFNEDLGGSFAGPVKLDIARVGDNYQFLANDVLKFTGTTYSSAVHDTFVNYLLTKGGDGGGTATIDDFGIVPEPSTTALLGLGGLALILRRRR
jgi:hypothetical protein